MGEYLFVVTALTLFMFFWINIFRSWYEKFLARRDISSKAIRTMMLILWVTLTLVFWYTLLHRGMPEQFTIGHFSFALFIFSLYSLIQTIVKKNNPSK